MQSEELRKKFISFFEKKGHKIVPSSSLIPEDGTVLLTSAGMQQFIPHLSGEKSPLEDFDSIHLTSVQKCFRSGDIEEVGDDTHHTFFEMLGNWSIGENERGYFKKGAIDLALEFFTKEIGLSKERLYVTVFEGNENIPVDEEAEDIWKNAGFPGERIMRFGVEDNFWGPVSSSGPCGPCSEINYDRGESYGCGKECGPNCENCTRFVELWNLVFMEYFKNEDGSYRKLPQRNVDTGIGFERLVALLQGKYSPYETDLFMPIIKSIEGQKKYEEEKRSFRVIADHVRGAVFLVADGIIPSNKEAGYILRRIIRRAVRYKQKVLLDSLKSPILAVIENYSSFYPELKSEKIVSVILEEEEKFQKTLNAGIKKVKNLSLKKLKPEELGKELFFVHQSYGFPFELAVEEMGSIPDYEKVEESFKEEEKAHRDISRKGAEEKFGGVRKEAGEREVMMHTATHILHQSLRNILGSHVKQMGSDITKERMRFDFSHSEKMTAEEIKKVEDMVNEKIKEVLEVTKEELPYEEAQRLGALAFFKEKYPDKVTVYRVGDFSFEICGGPHVNNTASMGQFKIIKEESSSSGVRRIKAVIHPRHSRGGGNP